MGDRTDLRTRLGTRFSRLLGRRLGLPPATHPDIARERSAAVTTPDGAVLLTDIWSPRGVADAHTVLIRTPYGRGGLQAIFAALIAQQGFRVVVQSSRGTNGSTGTFEAFRHDGEDAQTTVAWLRTQPWFSGKFATFGSSYVGYTQWALAMNPPPELAAMVVSIAPINPRTLVHHSGSFAYETMLGFISVMPEPPSRILMLLGQARRAKAIWDAAAALPLKDGYVAANRGRRSPFFEDCLSHSDPADPWWQPWDCTAAIERIQMPVLLQGGWHDFYTREVVAQYQALRERGVATSLTVAATTHSGFVRELAKTFPESVEWMRDAFAGRRSAREGAAVVQALGSGEWQSFPAWPPPDTTQQRWYLHAQGHLELGPPSAGEPDRYRYDPADPTPSIGGDLFGLRVDQDNRPNEARPDVLRYVSAALPARARIVGEVVLELWFSSSLGNVDLFARLCDVAPDGTSRTVCDVFRRFAEAGPIDRRQIRLVLSPSFYDVLRGHSLALLVSSGAHPRFARNTGSGEPLSTACKLVPADVAVFHEPDLPSSLALSLLA